MTKTEIKKAFFGAYNYRYNFLYQVYSLIFEDPLTLTLFNHDITTPVGTWVEKLNLPINPKDYDAFIKEHQKNFWKSELVDILYGNQ